MIPVLEETSLAATYSPPVTSKIVPYWRRDQYEEE